MQNNVKSMLCYFPYISLIISIIFLFTEKDNKEVRFNAIQAICLSIALYIITWLVAIILPGMISTIVSIAIIVLYAFLMYKAYTDDSFELPLIGSFAKSHA